MVLDKGLIHVYTGNGKGKTSAALGLCLRASGRGLRCCFIQFVKGVPSGEMFSIRKFSNIEFIQVGREGYDFSVTEEDKERAERGLAIARGKMEEFDVVVMDELNIAVYLGLVSVDRVLDLLKCKPSTTEVVITGRYAHPEIIKIADYVTVMELVKHPFYRGIPSREGIDY